MTLRKTFLFIFLCLFICLPDFLWANDETRSFTSLDDIKNQFPFRSFDDVQRDREISEALKQYSKNTDQHNEIILQQDSSLIAQELTYPDRSTAISESSLKRQNDLEAYRKSQPINTSHISERQKIIEQALDETTFKIKIGSMFIRGEQSFRLAHPDLPGNLSKLTYPLRGEMGFIHAEAQLTPRFSIDGRYTASDFKNETSKDEDWNFYGNHNGSEKFIDYQITEQNTKNKAFFWNANLFYRVYDWSIEEDKQISELLLADKVSLDIFSGYQYYKGKHTMIDPITKYERLVDGQWWYVPSVPLYEGLNSWYEVTYKGPRIGVRVRGDHGSRISSSINLAYAWLSTNAEAYWNLRDFRWRHRGQSQGSALSLDIEGEYRLSSRWLLGAGFHYMWQKHEKSLYSGTQPGSSFTDLDLARDTQMRLFGFSLQAGYRW
jgi:hypothetical protein